MPNQVFSRFPLPGTRGLAHATFICLLASSALATEPPPDSPIDARAPRDEQPPVAEDGVPVVALTHTARGARAHTYGASLSGNSTLALSGEVRDDSAVGGSFRVWASPVERLTLLGDAQRRDSGELAPSLAVQVRAWENAGLALGALGRLKSEGFAEIEGELEVGLLGSYDAAASHLDVNLVVGRGFEEEETDGEVSLRVGHDVLGFMRVGVDGRVRYRLAGDVPLVGGRKWDVFAGPQVTASFDHFFAGLLTGPTTVGVVDGVGWEGMLTLGGVL